MCESLGRSGWAVVLECVCNSSDGPGTVRPGHSAAVTATTVAPARSAERRVPAPEIRSQMHILEIAPPWFPVPPRGYGGIEQVVSTLTDGLVGRGHRVTLVACAGSDARADLVSPIATRPDPAMLGDVSTEVRHALGAYLLDGDFDVIHDHSGFVGLALAAARSGGPPVVHTLHGPWTDSTKKLYGDLHGRVHLVAISQSQQGGNPSVRYSGVVHNGIDVGRYPLRTTKENYLVFLGRANAEKGPVQAIEIARRAGLPLKMVVKRNEPPEHEFWEREVVPLIDEGVEVHGEVTHSEKVDLIGKARALLFPIQWEEPFGLVMVEAMACGTPVIAMRRGSVPEVVVHGESGFVCDSLTAMVDAISCTDAIDPNACRAVVEGCFSSSRMVDGYLSVFSRLCSAPSPECAA